MNEKPYIDFKGTKEQLNTFIKEIYNNLDNSEIIVDTIIKEEPSSLISNENFDDEDENDEKDFQLYFRNTHYHVCVKKIILDMMVTLLISIPTNDSFPIAPVLNTIWSSQKNIVKIRDIYFCTYLKLYYYGMTNDFSLDSLYTRIKDEKCNYDTTLFKCPFQSGTFCQLDREHFNEQIGFMLKDGVIEEIYSDHFRLTR